MQTKNTSSFTKEQQSLIIKGISDTMLKLSMPTFSELNKNLQHFGLSISNNEIEIKKNGLHQEFYDNGQLKSSGYYIDGKRNGLFQYFIDNGKVSEFVNYVDDKMDGLFQYFNKKNGNLLRSLNFVDGKPSGLYQDFDENGKFIKSGYN